jgi:hypothetical protein
MYVIYISIILINQSKCNNIDIKTTNSENQTAIDYAGKYDFGLLVIMVAILVYWL